MNTIGKWTGIALLSAAVLTLELASWSVAKGAMNEVMRTPEARAVGVAARVVGRAVAHEAIAGAERFGLLRARGDEDIAFTMGAGSGTVFVARGSCDDPSGCVHMTFTRSMRQRIRDEMRAAMEHAAARASVANRRADAARMRVELRQSRIAQRVRATLAREGIGTI